MGWLGLVGRGLVQAARSPAAGWPAGLCSLGGTWSDGVGDGDGDGGFGLGGLVGVDIGGDGEAEGEGGDEDEDLHGCGGSSRTQAQVPSAARIQ